MNVSYDNAPKNLSEWQMGLFAPSVSQLTRPETIDLLAKAGYQWVEWRVQTLEAIESSPWGKAFNTLTLDNLLEETHEVADCLASSNVRVSGMQVDAPENFPNLMPTVSAAAQQLGCTRIGITSPGFDPCVGLRSQQQIFRSGLQKWVDAFAGSGIRVCVETHFGSITPSTALVMDVLEPFSPKQVGVMWDPANMIYEGSEIPTMALDLIGPYLAEVHLKNGAWKREEDGRWNFEFCDLSKGLVPWPRVLKLLADIPYQGPLIVEDYRWMQPESKLANARQEYQQALLAAQDID